MKDLAQMFSLQDTLRFRPKRECVTLKMCVALDLVRPWARTQNNTTDITLYVYISLEAKYFTLFYGTE